MKEGTKNFSEGQSHFTEMVKLLIESKNNTLNQSDWNGTSTADIVKISKRAGSTFRDSLSREEIETCMLNAIYKALDKYEEGSQCKFTTYLYKGVQMECLTQKKFNVKGKRRTIKSLTTGMVSLHKISNSEFSLSDSIDYEAQTDMLDEIKNVCEDPQLIYDRFYKNMSIKEIAKNRNVCGETIRLKIKKNLKKLRRSISESV